MTVPLEDCVVLLDKQQGMTSFGAVREFRRLSGVRKVGHCGSLDPQATGLLLLCTGLATRLADVFVDQPKQYDARIQFGRATTSYDTEGQTTAQAPVPPLDAPVVQAALEAFRGEIEQVPPMVSALKHKGKRLYELARAGQQVERPARKVKVYDILLRDLGPTHADITVVCGRGCYVRSLAHDLGTRLGVPAHLAALRRRAIGPCRVEDAATLESLAAAREAGWRGELTGVRTLQAALAFLPELRIRPGWEKAVSHGAQPEIGFFAELPEVSGPHLLVSSDRERLLAVGLCDGRRQFARVRLLRVFPEPLALAGAEP